MAEFRNIENNGNWIRGNNYSFEVYFNSFNSIDAGFESGQNEQFVTNVYIETISSPFRDTYIEGHYEDNGNIFLKNGNVVSGIIIESSRELPIDEGKVWIKYNIRVDNDCPFGDIVVSTHTYLFSQQVG